MKFSMEHAKLPKLRYPHPEEWDEVHNSLG